MKGWVVSECDPVTLLCVYKALTKTYEYFESCPFIIVVYVNCSELSYVVGMSRNKRNCADANIICSLFVLHAINKTLSCL